MTKTRLSSIAALVFLLIFFQPGVGQANDEGHALYDSVCRACHAPENVMVSAPKAGNDVEWAERLRKGIDQLTKNAINGFQAMPPKGGCSECPPDQIRKAILFMAVPGSASSMTEKRSSH